MLRQLQVLRIRKAIMLTGDNERVGQVIGRVVGLDDIPAELLPEDKVRATAELLDTSGTEPISVIEVPCYGAGHPTFIGREAAEPILAEPFSTPRQQPRARMRLPGHRGAC